MNLSNELLEKAKAAKSAEGLLETAKAENIKLSAEEAEKVFAGLHQSGELSDEELDNVAGGCGDEIETKCPRCQSSDLKIIEYYQNIIKFECNECHKKVTVEI